MNNKHPIKKIGLESKGCNQFKTSTLVQQEKKKYLISSDISGVSRLLIKNEPGIYVFMKYACLDNKNSQCFYLCH